MEISGRLAAADVMVVELREDSLDAANVATFKDAFASITARSTRVVLDLDGVRFVDSSGMGALISCLRLVSERPGELRLASMSQPVRALFELMRMHRVFNIHPTAAEAVRAMG